MNKVNRLLLFGAVVSFISRGLVFAQTPPTLGVNLFAGVNITGATGSVYAVQSTANLAQSNSWTTVAFVQLNRTNMLFVDTSAPVIGNRFYRALVQNPPTNMIFVPPNTFTMGSPTNEQGRST